MKGIAAQVTMWQRWSERCCSAGSSDHVATLSIRQGSESFAPISSSARKHQAAVGRHAAQGRGVVVGSDKRSRLPDALDALLRVPALTPKALAARLKVAPQTGTALLRALQGRGVVREVTGRGSFRAFAI
jgi:ribosomal protein S25